MTVILITGCNGFIGASFARRAAARGWTVLGADLQPTDKTDCCRSYVEVDLGAPDALARLAALASPDLILHAGGVSGFMVETDNPTRIGAINIDGTMAVFEMARRAYARRVVICSSIMAYGPDRTPGVARLESEYPEPISVYGATKVASEALMHAYLAQYGVDGVALRFGHVYGPGRTTQCFVRDMLMAVRAGRSCHIPHARGSLRQYVYIDDVCQAIELALATSNPPSRVFNVTAGECHTLGAVADEICRQEGAFPVSFDDGVDLPNYRVGPLSLAGAQAVLGYVPAFTLAAGIREYGRYLAASDIA